MNKYKMIYSGLRSGKTNEAALRLAELAKNYTSIEIKVVSEEMKAAKNLADIALLFSNVACKDFHHEVGDRHGGYDCPIVERYNAAREKYYYSQNRT